MRPMRKRAETGDLRIGERVIAVEPIGRIPEGSLGKVKTVIGQTWTRYWVEWDSGQWMGALDNSQIVRKDHYAEFKHEQAEAAARASAPAAIAVTPELGAGEPAAAGATPASRVPAHLLERSAAARARKAAASA